MPHEHRSDIATKGGARRLDGSGGGGRLLLASGHGDEGSEAQEQAPIAMSEIFREQEVTIEEQKNEWV
jgi:hypothetical protein